METWSEVMARSLAAADVTAADVVHNAYGYGLFTGGLGFGLGAETIGAATVPVSGGFTKRTAHAHGRISAQPSFVALPPTRWYSRKQPEKKESIFRDA